MTQLIPLVSTSFNKLTLELALEVMYVHYHAVGRPDNKQNRYRTGEECECKELSLEEVRHWRVG